MPRSIKNLNQKDVQRNLAILQQLMREADPDIATDRGPFHDLVLYYSACFTAANQRDIAEAMRAINLGRLAKDPNAVSPDHVDRVLANWLVRRRHGTPASGLITLITYEQMGFIVPPGTMFHANGHTFRTKAIYQIRAHGEPTTESERMLVRQSRGVWACNIPVVSTTPGSTSNLRRGTQVRFDKNSLPYVRKAYAAKDFTGGADEETNHQMFSRLVRSAGGKIWSNRLTGEALICKIPRFDRTLGISIIGFGDPEMLRDKHSLWPGSMGGRSDVYIKTQGGILTKEVRLPGYVVKERADGTIWEIQISRNVAPGFFYVASVSRVDGGRCTIVEDRRSFDTKGADVKPDIATPLEAAYSAYQTATLHVLEQNVVGMPDDKANFLVDFRYLDGIDKVQEHLSDRSIASPAGDVLVKAPIPCFTAVDIEVQRRPRDPQVRTAAIKEAVANAINSTGFVGHLAATTIMGVVAGYLEETMIIKEITLTGKIRYPDGKIETLQPGKLLSIPNDPSRLVSPRTVAFFQDLADIHVHVVTVDDPKI